jgi:hypothetical protein
MARRIGTVAGEPSLSASAVTGRQSICAIEDLPRMGLYRVPWHRMKKLLARRHHTRAGFCMEARRSQTKTTVFVFE